MEQDMPQHIGLEGIWQVSTPDGFIGTVNLPGSLDTNEIGHADTINSNGSHNDATAISTRLTRRHTYEGPVTFRTHSSAKTECGERIFFEVERARCLRLRVNGTEIRHYKPETLNTPHVFEVTDQLTGDDEITVISDNSYPGLPHDAIVNSSAATDETQTNWNGLLGYIRLRREPSTFIDSVRVYPHAGSIDVYADISSVSACAGTLSIDSPALYEKIEQTISMDSGRNTIIVRDLRLRNDVRRWDEFKGNLQELTTTLHELGAAQPVSKTITFGVRDFGDNGKGRLSINHRIFFLRGEANCAEFPETGFCPLTVHEWEDILETYRSYGVNVMRFHSHCPPDAAFTAADHMGMMMQPELSHWDYKHAFESEESFSYYRTEIEETILFLANHPSFVMLSLGNELCANDLGHERMRELLRIAKSLDHTRLYANSSNPHYGEQGSDPENDFYASQSFHGHDLRACFADMKGYLNNQYPNTRTNYNGSMHQVRESVDHPVFGFEVGQYEVLPDFREIIDFQGVTSPENYRVIRNRVRDHGIDENTWERYVRATGELSLLCYREEVESALRTAAFSGLSLLGLQDFPGQGTALVGMLNSHLRAKPYDFARPERFHSFFTDQLALVLLPKYTYTCDELLTGEVKISNYGTSNIDGQPRIVLRGQGYSQEVLLPQTHCPTGELTDAGSFSFDLGAVPENRRYDLEITIRNITNTYPVWVYLPQIPRCPDSVLQTEHLDSQALEVLDGGGAVYLSPKPTKEALPTSIVAHFSTDFWSVGTFTNQSGTMGQFIDTSHPIFETFPTEEHTNWQWWPMATQRAIVLPKAYESIVTELDSYAFLRPMTQLLECRCGNGRLILSSMGLQHLQRYPEARALQSSIYRYMASPAFRPKQAIDVQTVRSLVH